MRLHADDDAGRGEARDRVDMPVGMVVQQPFADPDRAGRAEGGQHAFLDLGFRRRGAPVTVRIQEALLGREQGSFAVDVDRATLEDPGVAARRVPRGFGEARRHGRIEREHVLLAPAVEGEAYGGQAPVEAVHEDRRRVAQPDVAEVDAVKACFESGQGAFRVAGGALIRNEDLELLARADGAAELAELGLRAGQVLFPQVGGARPREPAGAVRGPFGGLANRIRHAGLHRRSGGAHQLLIPQKASKSGGLHLFGGGP